MTIEWNFILRLFIAGILGGLIGFEREFRAKEAGVRTHFIVALGSALFMLISQYGFTGQFDHARVAAQVVSGIGFIGAGVIIFQKNVIRGVTTAAGMWVAAAIGLACGAGMYAVSVAAMLMTVICLETMNFVTHKYGERLLTVAITPVDGEEILQILESFKSARLDVHSFTVSEGKAVLHIRSTHKDYLNVVKDILSLTKGYKVEII